MNVFILQLLYFQFKYSFIIYKSSKIYFVLHRLGTLITRYYVGVEMET